jgi:hypothetical protein
MKTQRHWKPWLAERYSHVWGPAAILATALSIYTAIVVRNRHGTTTYNVTVLFFLAGEFVSDWQTGIQFF